MGSVYFDANGQSAGRAAAQPNSFGALKRAEAAAETIGRATEIQTILSGFFGPPSSETKRYRKQHLKEISGELFNLVTLDSMQFLVDSTPESKEFNMRLKAAAKKAYDTPLVRPDGTLVTHWIHGYIALAIDSGGNVLGFDDLPVGRAKFLNYQVPKALRAKVLSEQVGVGERDPSREENIRLLERFGVERRFQYTGAQDYVQLQVGSSLRWVYLVGGATQPDQAYVNNVYGTQPKGYSQLEGVGPLEGEMDSVFGELVLYYMVNPNAEVKPVPEPKMITRARSLFRK